MTAVSAVRGGPRPTKGRFTEKAMRDSGPLGKSQARTMAEGAKALRRRWSRRPPPCTDALTPPLPSTIQSVPRSEGQGSLTFRSILIQRLCLHIPRHFSSYFFLHYPCMHMYSSTLVSNFKKFDPVTFSFLRVDFVCLT